VPLGRECPRELQKEVRTSEIKLTKRARLKCGLKYVAGDDPRLWLGSCEVGFTYGSQGGDDGKVAAILEIIKLAIVSNEDV
jgi:hypothetical protein